MTDGQQHTDDVSAAERPHPSPTTQDPRDADHPAGIGEATENAENESPS